MDMKMITEAEAKIMSHEAVCAERYDNIQKRMQRMEILQYITMVCVLLGPNVAADLIKKLVGV